MKERKDFLVGISKRSQKYSAIEPIAVRQTNHLTENEVLNDFHSNLGEEFLFLNNYMPLSDQEADAAYGIFRWLAAQFVESSSNTDLAPLLPVLLVGTALSWGGDQLWKELKSVGPIRNSRLQELKQLIALRQFSFSNILHIAHNQTIQLFQEACEKNDWPGVDEIFHHIDGLLYDAPLSSAAKALNIFSPPELESALVEIRDVASLLTVLQSIQQSTVEYLGIAARHENLPLKFCAFYLSTEKRRPETQPEFEQLQTQILSQVAKNNQEWHEWMVVFNSYPSRYPTLQRALGKALCVISKEAIEQYFNAIQLAIFRERGVLAVAFDIVERNAEISQKALIWAAAFERWNKWCFNKGDNQRPMIYIETSALDVAVSAYYRDCLSVADKDAAEAEFHSEFLQIQSDWYEKITDYLEAFNRHLSRYQPLSHGRVARMDNEQWIDGNKWYLPPWIPAHHYWKIRTRIPLEIDTEYLNSNE